MFTHQPARRSKGRDPMYIKLSEYTFAVPRFIVLYQMHSILPDPLVEI